MIKNIFLHIGIHKTASTTIQNSLYTEREKLAEAGILYPVFNIRENNASNHSIAFYSLICEEPQKYHINVGHGFTTKIFGRNNSREMFSNIWRSCLKYKNSNGQHRSSWF